MPVTRVAIIGGGVSGLVSTKTCLEEGLEPVCFEQSDQYGGVWVMRDETSTAARPAATVYDCLLTNSCKHMMCFSDFPFDGERSTYLQGRDVWSYYQRYAKNFGLEPHIRLNTSVLRVEPTADFEVTGQWKVTSQRVGSDPQDEVFSAVLVCSGRHTHCHIPHFPGLSDYRGEIEHSGDFKNGQKFAGKTVVVIGGSHSAGDVAVDVSRYAKRTFLAMRGGTWVFPRQGPGSTPIDAFLTRRVWGLLPVSVRRMIIGTVLRQRLNFKSLGLQSERPLFQSTNVMINDEIGVRIWCDALKAKPNVARFTETGVVFTDGSEVDNVDAVVFATGFEVKFPFLEKFIVNDDDENMELYWHIFPPRLAHHTIGLIGNVIAFGPQPPVYELQARLATRVFKGLISLPKTEEMLADVSKRKMMYFKLFGKHKIFFPPIPYMDMLAEKVGCRPRLLDLFKIDPRFPFKYLFGPCYPMYYRLVGPNAWSGAHTAILQARDEPRAKVVARTKSVDDKSPDADKPTSQMLESIMEFNVALYVLVQTTYYHAGVAETGIELS
ncbi:flavin-containing monooxygenase 5-like [Diadema setosum]|uniref:flavin-containing monooxygenase 5-like n=1 Tax=Diadema setosum TaxID=31175 RepID=UPI003B3B5493